MRDFHRNNLLFSLCGLNCGLCQMKLGGYCPGCGGGDGNQSCQIAKCSMQHNGVEYCFLCAEYPCEKYQSTEEYDSFITHQRQLKDIERAQAMGIEAYTNEQVRKVQILQTLLAHYNDGRRKTFYSLAVNLLPLADIENIIRQFNQDISLDSLPLKEKTEHLTSLFTTCPEGQHVVLKLRKKANKACLKKGLDVATSAKEDQGIT